MPLTQLTFTMKNRLSQILYSYQDNNDLNEYTDSHIDHCSFLLCDKPYDEVLNYLMPYKLDIQLAIEYHKTQEREVPTNTYNRLGRLIDQL